MNIAISTLAIGFAGGKDYAKMLIKHLAENDRDNNYFIFLNPQKEELIKEAENFQYIKCGFPSRNIIFRLLWEQLYLPFILKRRRIDVLYNLSGYDVFFAPCKKVLKIANMAPFCQQTVREADPVSKARLFLLKYLGLISFKTVDAVIVMSESAKTDLLKKTGASADKFFGILHSADIQNLKDCGDTEEKLVDGDYALAVSNIYPYKKLIETIEAFHIFLKESKNPSLKLVIAGAIKNKKYYAKVLKFIKDKDLGGKVVFLGFVPRNQLYWLYKRCKIFIFSSIVETCSRALIEAMKCGTAILCSERSVLPEICQEAAVYFDPDNPVDLSEKMEKLLQSSDLIEQMKTKSLKRAEEFDWDKTALKTLEALERVAS